VFTVIVSIKQKFNRRHDAVIECHMKAREALDWLIDSFIHSFCEVCMVQILNFMLSYMSNGVILVWHPKSQVF
jgi:hypothetical protein